MRPADRRSTRLLENALERDAHAIGVQQVDDLRGAGPAHLPELDELRVDRNRAAEMKAEHVRLVLVLDRAQLDPGHETNAKALTLHHRFGEPGGRIVIGERDGRETRLVRFLDDDGRRESAVRRRRVRVEVDEGRGGSASGSRHAA